MDKISKSNDRIAKKQIGRLVGGVASIMLGLILIGKYTYQKGYTGSQKDISDIFPDEYAAMTEKIVKTLESH